MNIIEHADVRRMLLLMHSRTMAMRALVFEAASNLDLARHAQDETVRKQALQLAEYLMPEMHTLAHRINISFSEMEG